MESLPGLLDGFRIVLRPENLAFALTGSIIGTAVGVLPGIGPIAGIAILLPLTFSLDATGAIIMLAAIYYGAMYGGTITTVLMRIPGEGASAVMAIDGYEMARQGRAGAALSIAAIGSFVGGMIATAFLVLAAAPLARMALAFGPPEFFGIMLLGLSLVVGLGGGSPLTGIVSGLFGLALSIPGTDFVAGTPRMTFGRPELLDGISFIPVIMGLYGIGEILYNLESGTKSPMATIQSKRVSGTELRQSAMPMVRGTLLGTFCGLIPGIGTLLPTIMSYAIEKRVSPTPERFGHGAIEGVAGPETTNNAYAHAAFIPLFTLGVPASPTIAVLLGALMMNGLTPGPFLFEERGDFVWAVIASFTVGNVILLMLNLPLIGLWVRLLRVPYSILFPMVIGFTAVGSYVARNSAFDVGVLAVFGVIGYVARKIDFPVAPMAFTLILGPLIENALRQSLAMSGGSASVFFRGPLSGGLLLIAVLITLGPLARRLWKRHTGAH